MTDNGTETRKCQCGEVTFSGDVITDKTVGGVLHSVARLCAVMELDKTPDQVFEQHTDYGEPEPPEETNLFKHALRELEIAGIPEEDREKVLKVVKEFASWHCSGGEASWYIHVIVRLLQCENMADLTDNPGEWTQVSEDPPTWQAQRNAEAFSNDGGKTYYLLSETVNPRNPDTVHTSSNHLKRGY